MTVERQVGDWIGDRFEIHDVHRGGMGIVYIVYDHQGAAGQRVLALKTLLDRFLNDPNQVARFIAECHTWVKLDRHPHIVRAYSVQEIEAKPYILLELVTGGSLRRWIGTPQLDVPQVLRFGVQFCLGMEHAVSKGLKCHRDLKPENILISDGGTLKVTDFGLAKVRDATPADDPGEGPIPLDEPGAGMPSVQPTTRARPLAWADVRVGEPASTINWPSTGSPTSTVDWPGRNDPGPCASKSEPDLELEPDASIDATRDPDPNLTGVGTTLGTWAYMPPEQFDDAKVADIRADIYAFGIVLFEMITGSRPFRGETLAKLERQHARDHPPTIVPYVPRKYAPIARELDQIVGRCLEKDRARRYASFPDLRLDLARLLWRAAHERVRVPSEAELEAWELTSKGVSLGTLGRHDEERQCYEESIRVKPDYAPAWFNQAAALGAQGRPDEAIDFAEMAHHLNPESVPALINKGLALRALGRLDEAIAYFDRAVHLQPRTPEVWFGRGVVLLDQGNGEGALAALDQALRLRPEFPEAIRAVECVRLGTRPRDIPWVRRTEDSGADSCTR